MLRGLLLTACLLLVAGCASPAPPAAEPVPAAEVQEAEPASLEFEGYYDSVVVNGEALTNNGGVHAIEVAGAGWSEVLVRLDVHVETVLVLLPPGCSADQPCALRLSAPPGKTDILANLPAMEAGTWTTAMELQASGPGRFASSQYTLTLDYLPA